MKIAFFVPSSSTNYLVHQTIEKHSPMTCVQLLFVTSSKMTNRTSNCANEMFKSNRLFLVQLIYLKIPRFTVF